MLKLKWIQKKEPGKIRLPVWEKKTALRADSLADIK